MTLSFKTNSFRHSSKYFIAWIFYKCRYLDFEGKTQQTKDTSPWSVATGIFQKRAPLVCGLLGKHSFELSYVIRNELYYHIYYCFLKPGSDTTTTNKKQQPKCCWKYLSRLPLENFLRKFRECVGILRNPFQFKFGSAGGRLLNIFSPSSGCNVY